MAMINGKNYDFKDIKVTIGGVEVETTAIEYNTEDEENTPITPNINKEWKGEITIDLDKGAIENIRASMPMIELKPLEFTSDEMIELLNELGLEDQAHKIIPDMIYTVTN